MLISIGTAPGVRGSVVTGVVEWSVPTGGRSQPVAVVETRQVTVDDKMLLTNGRRQDTVFLVRGARLAGALHHLEQ